MSAARSAMRSAVARAEETEIPLCSVLCKQVPQQLAHLACRFVALCRRLLDVDRIFRKVGKIELYQELATVGMRVGPHATVPLRRECRKLRDEAPLLVEHVCWLIAAHPLLQKSQMIQVHLHIRDRYLVCTKCALDRNAIDLLRSGPPFGSTQDNNRPGRYLRESVCASLFLIRANFRIAGVQGLSECLVHTHGIVALNKVNIVAMPREQFLYPIVNVTPQDGWTRNLVPIQM